MDVFPLSGQEDDPRRFQACWFRTLHWLKYSLEGDVVFFFLCYLFSINQVHLL